MSCAFEKFLECFGANNVTLLGAEVRIFEVEVELRCRQQVLFVRKPNLNATREPRLVRRAKLVSVEAYRRLDALNVKVSGCGKPASVTQMDRDDVIRLTRHHPERRAHRASLLSEDLDYLNVMFSALDRVFLRRARGDRLGRSWTDERNVVPRYFR